MKPACISAEKELDRLRSEASENGLELRVAYPISGTVATLHVMFDSAGQRVLNWWPAKGTTLDFARRRGQATVGNIIAQACLALDRMSGCDSFPTAENEEITLTSRFARDICPVLPGTRKWDSAILVGAFNDTCPFV